MYSFKVNNGNARTPSEICSKFTINTSEKSRSGVCIANFEQISYCSGVSIVDFEQVNANWASTVYCQYLFEAAEAVVHRHSVE